MLALPILLLAADLAAHEEWLQSFVRHPAALACPCLILYVAAYAIGRVFDGFAPSHRWGASE